VLTLLPERAIALLLRLETEPSRRVALEEVLQERDVTLRNGFSLSEETSQPGSAALAILLPVPRGTRPMTLGVGGPMRQIAKENARLLKMMTEAVEPMRRVAAGCRHGSSTGRAAWRWLNSPASTRTPAVQWQPW
jgi:DNA-binding IclR family transcriptional regulator